MPLVFLRNIAGDELRLEELPELDDLRSAIDCHWAIPAPCQRLICNHCGEILCSQIDLVEYDKHLSENGDLIITVLVSIEAVCSAVKGTDQVARQRALKALRRLGKKCGEDAVSAILESLQKVSLVRDDLECTTLEVLGHIAKRGDERTMNALKRWLQHGSRFVRNAAVKTFGRVANVGDERALAIASSLLEKDSLLNARTALALMLEVVGRASEKAISVVIDHLKHESINVRCAAIEAVSLLVRRGDQNVCTAAATMLEHDGFPVRLAVIEALARAARQTNGLDQCMIAAVSSHLDHELPAVRSSAIQALRQLASYGDARVVASASARLEHTCFAVRCTAIDALLQLTGRLHDNVVSACISRCIHDDCFVRRSAVDAIAEIAQKGDGLAIHALVARMLLDPHAGVRSAAVRAVINISEKGDARVTLALTNRLADVSPDVRCAALVGLREMVFCHKGESTMAAVIACLQDDEALVRREAVQALFKLGAVGDTLLIEGLHERLHDVDPNVRCIAFDAIAVWTPTGDKRAIDVALRGLRDLDNDVQECAVAALMKVANANDVRVRDAVDAHLKGKGSVAPYTRWLVEDACSQFGSENAIPPSLPLCIVSVMWIILRKGVFFDLPVALWRLRDVLRLCACASRHWREVMQALRARALDHDIAFLGPPALPPFHRVSVGCRQSREIVHIQVGQCGNQLGFGFWDSLLLDHGLDACGCSAGNSDVQNDCIQVYFHETADGRHVPRAILADSDPRGIELARGRSHESLFRPDAYISGHYGCGSNWARGFYSEGHEIADVMLDAVRKEVEACDCVQGFQIMHGLGGGTGSGLGSLVLMKLREEFPDLMALTYSVTPSYKVTNNVIEPYACVMGLHYLTENSDACVVIDNEILYDTVIAAQKTEAPTYADLNSIANCCLSSLTSCLRFPDTMRSNLRKLAFELVPFPRLHFLSCGTSALRSNVSNTQDASIACEMMRQALDGKNLICKADPRRGHYLAASLVLSGSFSMTETEQSVASLLQRGRQQYGDWDPTDLRLTASSGRIMREGVRGECALVGNTTAIQEVFRREHESFVTLYRRKAFLSRYGREGMDEMEFDEASENVIDLISGYQEHESVSMFTLVADDEEGNEE